MSDKPSTQGKQESQQPLTWDAIGKLTKEEYSARRDEVRAWLQKNISNSGRVISK